MVIAGLKSRFIKVLKYLYKAEVPTRAASVSYYAMLASIPLLAIVVTISAQMLPDLHHAHDVGVGDLTTQEVNRTLSHLLPQEANKMIKGEIVRIQSQPPLGLLSAGLLLSLWTASNAYMALNSAMNQIYNCVETRPYWQVRLTAFIMPVILTVILVSALVAMLTAPYLINFLALDKFSGALMTVAQFGVLFFILVSTFELAYRLGPRRRLSHRLVSTGAVIGAGIFLGGSLLFQLYVQNYGSYDRVYGSLGGFIVFLVWIWLANACLLTGCAVNKCLDDERLAPLKNIREVVRTLD